jgi:hypothetical protein
MTEQESNNPKLKSSIVTLLRPYFEKNCTSDYTSSKTGFARGTVQKYFKRWTNQMIEELDNDFIKMQKESKIRGLLALDRMINQLTETLEELKMLNDKHMDSQKRLWKKNKTHDIELNKYLVDKIAKYTKDIFNMEQVKILIQMKPTADISLQLQIDEMLAKVKPEDLQHLIDEAKETTL